MTDAQLLAAARRLVATGVPAGVWPRAAALTARQALEAGLRRLWLARAPGLERATTAAQLACLPPLLGDPELAGETAFAWAALSAACHHHDYELTPTVAELEHRFAVVDRLLDRVTHVTGGVPTSASASARATARP